MKVSACIISLLLTAVSTCLPSHAEPTHTGDPEKIAMLILNADPSILAARLDNEALGEALKTEGNLPDPEIEGEYLFAPSGETNRWGAGISWGLEWPGVYSARRDENKGKLASARASMSMAATQRLTEIKRLLLDYVFQDKQLDVLHNVKGINDSIMALAAKAEHGGEMTRLDLNKLRIESAALNARIADIMANRAATIVSLSEIYGKDCSALLSGMICEFPDLTPPQSPDMETSPSVAAANAEVAAAIKGEKVASMEGLPGISFGYQHAFEEGLHFNGASLGVSIPIFSSRNKKKSAKATVAAARQKAESAKLSATENFNGNLRKLGLLKSQIDETAPLLEETDNLTLLMKAYRGGVITLIDYLNERSYFTEAELDLISLRYTAASTLLDLQQHIPLL